MDPVGGGGFAELYAAHYSRLVRFCRHRLGRDVHAAEEVAQEAFVRAFANLDSLRDERRFYPWLVGIARRLIVDVYRDAQRQARGIASLGSVVPTAARETPEGLVLGRLADEQLLEALTRLSPRHQEVLRLREWEGLSSAEIAARLDISAETVRQLLYRARLALRQECRNITFAERLAAMVPFAVLGGLRRARDRWAPWAGNLPGMGTFGAAMPTLMLGAGALFMVMIAADAPATVDPRAHHPLASMAGWGVSHGDGRQRGADPGSTDTGGLLSISSEPSSPRVRHNVRVGRLGSFRDGVASVHTGERAHDDQRRAREEMPIYHEIGPFFIAIDPDQAHQETKRALTPD